MLARGGTGVPARPLVWGRGSTQSKPGKARLLAVVKAPEDPPISFTAPRASARPSPSV